MRDLDLLEIISIKSYSVHINSLRLLISQKSYGIFQYKEKNLLP